MTRICFKTLEKGGTSALFLFIFYFFSLFLSPSLPLSLSFLPSLKNIKGK
jgi:hypothetical protein